MMRRLAVLSLTALIMPTACADHHAPATAPDPAVDASPAMEKPAMTNANSDVELYFVSLKDGDVVESPVRVVFGLRGMGVAPAGTDVGNTGHHHLLVDLAELPDLSAPLPATDNIRHFGGGQTETSVELAPGEHTLQLLLGNFIHVPHSPPVMSPKITVTVK